MSVSAAPAPAAAAAAAPAATTASTSSTAPAQAEGSPAGKSFVDAFNELFPESEPTYEEGMTPVQVAQQLRKEQQARDLRSKFIEAMSNPFDFGDGHATLPPMASKDLSAFRDFVGRISKDGLSPKQMLTLYRLSEGIGAIKSSGSLGKADDAASAAAAASAPPSGMTDGPGPGKQPAAQADGRAPAGLALPSAAEIGARRGDSGGESMREIATRLFGSEDKGLEALLGRK